jgi:beta-lactamase class A
MNEKLKWVILAAVFLGIGFLAGRFLFVENGKPRVRTNQRIDMSEIRNKSNYKFINPLLECDNSSASGLHYQHGFEEVLQGYIATTIKNGSASEIAVYYRDLNNGPWIGIGYNKPFSPASLLKVPVMIAALKKAEMDKSLMKEKFELSPSPEMELLKSNISDEVIQVGHKYTYENLIFRMMAYSDNYAMGMLKTIVGEQLLADVWTDLGLMVPTSETSPDFLTVKEYSSFFRVLYNATYLSKEYSEIGLKIMSNCTFDAGLQKGLPDSIQLSNKFGERGLADSNLKQLHDCGIVYAPNSPYLICVMTRGVDWDTQATIIAQISQKVYAAHTQVK